MVRCWIWISPKVYFWPVIAFSSWRSLSLPVLSWLFLWLSVLATYWLNHQCRLLWVLIKLPLTSGIFIFSFVTSEIIYHRQLLRFFVSWFSSLCSEESWSIHQPLLWLFVSSFFLFVTTRMKYLYTTIITGYFWLYRLFALWCWETPPLLVANVTSRCCKFCSQSHLYGKETKEESWRVLREKEK